MNDPATAGSDWRDPEGPMLFVVDDEPMIGKMLGMVLRSQSYPSTVFNNPKSALEAFRNAGIKPVLLITDYQMPDMKGIDLIRDCKAIHPTLKTILCSGTVDEDFLRTLQPQPDRLVAKPFFPMDMMQTVKALLDE